MNQNKLVATAGSFALICFGVAALVASLGFATKIGVSPDGDFWAYNAITGHMVTCSRAVCVVNPPQKMAK